MKKFLKWLGQRPFIKGFLRFYMASESDITSIAVAYYLLISILPLLLIAANILPYFQIRPTQILLTLREVVPHCFASYFIGAYQAVYWFAEFLHHFCFMGLFTVYRLPAKSLQ